MPFQLFFTSLDRICIAVLRFSVKSRKTVVPNQLLHPHTSETKSYHIEDSSKLHANTIACIEEFSERHFLVDKDSRINLMPYQAKARR